MFTGLISDVGRLAVMERRHQAKEQGAGAEGDYYLQIETAYETNKIALGASVACNGICLTVVDKGANWLAFDASLETARVTTIASWQLGARINLERSLKLGDEMGGHIVSGHVDGTASLIKLEEEAGSWQIQFLIAQNFAPLVVAKGSLALDGISLTVNQVYDRPDACVFTVNIIPHTRLMTNLVERRVGDKLNVEFDLLARYVARMRQLAA